MKKFMAMILALAMVCAMLAGCGNKEPQANEPVTKDPTEVPTEAPTEEPTEAPVVEVPGSALEILEKVWALFGEDEKFPVMGGDLDNVVDGAPGSFDISELGDVAYFFYLGKPEYDQLTEAASLFHAMNLNNFTCGAFRVNGDVEDFGASVHDLLANAQWICGMPDQMFICSLGEEYVVMAFGISDAMEPFESKLLEAYPGAQVLYSEPIV